MQSKTRIYMTHFLPLAVNSAAVLQFLTGSFASSKAELKVRFDDVHGSGRSLVQFLDYCLIFFPTRSYYSSLLDVSVPFKNGEEF